MHEVEEKGWDHTKPHQIEKTGIKQFMSEGAPVVIIQPEVEVVAEPVASTAVEQVTAIVEQPIIAAIPIVRQESMLDDRPKNGFVELKDDIAKQPAKKKQQKRVKNNVKSDNLPAD